MKYIILEEFTAEELTKSVNKLLAEGWLLQGGISYSKLIPSMTNHNVSYCQALIKE